MKDTVYLIVNKNGVHGMRKTPPDLKGGEHAVRLQVNVDDRFFKAAIPTALLEIGEEFLITPEIDVDIEPPEDL